MSIPIQWIAKVANNKEKKEELEALLRNNTIILEVLHQIIDERENSLQDTLFSLSTSRDINKDNIIGRIGELREIKKLLTIG